MRHHHTAIAIAITLGALGATGIPADRASAAVVTSQSSGARTAPGMPRFGEKGPMVEALQKAIMSNGFTLKGGATGVFDARTRRVLRTFQKVVGLRVTGVVDAGTASVLKLTTAAAVQSAPGSTAAPTTTTVVPVPSYPLSESDLPVRGDRGDDVLSLQNALVAAGITLKGGADGIFGGGTAAAVASYQTSKGLPATGVLDPATARSLGLVAPAAPVQQVSVSATNPPLTIETLPRRGQKSSAVVTLQNALVDAGIALKGGVDGVFGAATTTALRAYQTANNLEVSGEADVPTALKLGLIDRPDVSIDVFPVQGPCNFVDTWHAPRGGGRLHLGVDIIAAEGNLIYAAVAGRITKVYTVDKDLRAGNGFRLTAADGTYFFYGHLQRFADGITLGSSVKAGQVLGTVGKTGDTNTPHLHFEVHPRGGDAVNAYPIAKAVDACRVTAPLPAP